VDCPIISTTEQFAGQRYDEASDQSAGRHEARGNSIQSGIACEARPRTSFAASRNSPLSSIQPCCITTGWNSRWYTGSPSVLDHSALSGDLIRQAYDEALRDEPDLGNAFRADLVAVYDRDPATSRFIDPLLYFKGFHALQTHRLAHWLLKRGRKDFAYYLQSRSSSVFQTDINPAAIIGRGIFLDHATGFVCGETAVIEGRRLDPARRHARRYRQGETRIAIPRSATAF